jgi:hypothetical protein
MAKGYQIQGPNKSAQDTPVWEQITLGIQPIKNKLL